MYYFTEDCLTGIEKIDDEHRQLFELLNEIVGLLSSNRSEIQDALIQKTVYRLKKYAEEHFLHEEQYMEKIEDPEIIRQKKEHAIFKMKMENFEMEFSSNKDEIDALREIMEYMVRWLYHHILGSDIMIGKIQKNSHNDPFAFTDQYKTGISLVDEEHQKLFDIIRQTNDLIHAENLYDKYDEIINILNELKNYTVMHFSDEEDYMTRIHYEGIEAQKRAHEAFVTKLNEINLEEVDENQQKTLELLVDYLLNWLTNHILKVDKLIPVEEG